MTEPAPAASTVSTPQQTHSGPGRSRRPRQPAEREATDIASSSNDGQGQRRRRPKARPAEQAAGPAGGHAGGAEGAHSATTDQNAPSKPAGASRRQYPRRNREAHEPSHSQDPSNRIAGSANDKSDSKQSVPPKAEPKHSHRRAKFNSSLTEAAPAPKAPESQQTDGGSFEKDRQKYRSALPQGDDLTSRLIRELSLRPYPDCLICFAPIHRDQPTWSCSPSTPIALSDDEGDGKGDGGRREGETAQCCWTTFHLKCIKQWASKSVKDVVEAWRARGEERAGEWRCPGCQMNRAAVPSGYWCFCGSTPEPKPPRLSTPHSCGNPCSRPRPCGHSCPLACHPGPCPPCPVTTQLPCHCGKQTLSFRCAHLAPGKASGRAAAELSCGAPCGKGVSCGNHYCEETCHSGPCPPCKIREMARCYCGKEERELGCGVGEEKECTIIEGAEQKKWLGRFACEGLCERAFDCGFHRCLKPCHPPSPTSAHCPRSPDIATHCPCGKHALTPFSAQHFPRGTFLPRTSCTDPVPTCASICMKPLAGCAHTCAVRCHAGPCPPCTIKIVRPCRCGATTRDVSCAEDQARARRDAGVEEILCDRPCGALRACGRHQCNRLCCPLASFAASARGKGKKRAGTEGVLVDDAGWHECDLVCGKMLGCGNHRCEQRDHRGVCPPCLRSLFEEIICQCGRTVLEPPIPCGTRINCHYTCARPPPPCGHPKSQHMCHEAPTLCPPCPFLTSKKCACGKKTVDNVRCSQDKVSCGTTCGRLLSCGFHHCERLCHADACGPCAAVCGKPRKLCLPVHHPCTQSCHAPAACSEAEPCRAIINITCPCGRIRQPVACGRSIANPAGREGSQQLKCSNECLIAKRNARLAEALGINPDRGTSAEKQVVYNDDLVAFAKANPKFCTMVEKSFADFLSSDKKSQILAHMPESRRKFVHDLAAIYRLDTRMVDQEPQRSVQLIRRIDSRVPAPLLSSAASAPRPSPASSMPNLGKLADLRGPGMHMLSLSRASPGAASAPPPTGGSAAVGGWRAVVARQPQAGPSQSAWGAPSAPSRPSTSPVPPHPPSQVPATNVQTQESVPDNWEDDV